MESNSGCEKITKVEILDEVGSTCTALVFRHGKAGSGAVQNSAKLYMTLGFPSRSFSGMASPSSKTKLQN
jgi:hypothetical protein